MKVEKKTMYRICFSFSEFDKIEKLELYRTSYGGEWGLWKRRKTAWFSEIFTDLSKFFNSEQEAIRYLVSKKEEMLVAINKDLQKWKDKLIIK